MIMLENFYGRKKIRTLKKNARRRLLEIFPSVCVTPETVSNFIKGYKKITLEIGFGDGEHIFHQARSHPSTLFIGCEPFLNGVTNLLKQIEEENIKNIAIYRGDCRILLEKLPKNSLKRIFILFPDPWPKKRHHKRRLITKEFLLNLHFTLQNECFLTVATDHENYQDWILEQLYTLKDYFSIKVEKRDYGEGGFQTKYEKKALLEGRNPLYYHCTRL